MSTTEVALSLISHTNAGKTTLARTLLGRDIGEVGDVPHLTTEATSYLLQDTPEGDALVLWDTPGFGDSARLARRLAQQDNPIGWFLSQVWDRFRDRPLYLSQRAVRNARDEADVVLYLVNASETPADAGYLAPELDVLEWIGRPVFVLLNQTGPPRPRAEEEAELSNWRNALDAHPVVRGVLALDAFARCWVQEIVLLRALAPTIAPAKRDAYGRLIAAWQVRRMVQFDESMAVLAMQIASAACDRVSLATPGFKDRVREVVRSVVATPKESEQNQKAARLLAERLDAGVRDSTARLIAIHGLPGRATDAWRTFRGRVGPRRRPRSAWAHLWRRRTHRCDRRRTRRRRNCPWLQRCTRPDRVRDPLGRRTARPTCDLGAAALPRGRALRSWTGRLAGKRVSAVLARDCAARGRIPSGIADWALGAS
jgi:hypothetical protein